MSWSLSETRTLAIKAAKGGGLSWGLAEEAGFAVCWLQARGAPGVQALAAYLSWRDLPRSELAPLPMNGAQPDPAAFYCPIALGAAISDGGGIASTHLGHVRQPLLLVPFVATATRSGCRSLTWDDTDISIANEELETALESPALLAAEADCRLARGRANMPRSSRTSRVPESEAAHLSVLASFAARTYAPSTEQSRLAGAGSGLNDND